MPALNSILRLYFTSRMKRIESFMKNPHEAQQYWFDKLIRNARNTEWGIEYDYKSINNQHDFANRIPVQDYEALKPYIERMMYGEKNVLWTGRTKWFSKSSGTTSDKSKYIPVSQEHYDKCLIQGTRDTLTLYYHNHPDSKFFSGKGMVMGGSWEYFKEYPKTVIGDVSALMVQHMPALGKFAYTPDLETALMKDWEPKIEKMAHITSTQNVTNLGGVPTWTIVLFRRILELTGKSNMLEVWPNFEVYIHGGVSFTPYRKQFEALLPSSDVNYMEIYNASEGYFSIQSESDKDDMLLMLDNGIYYEFLPAEEWDKEYPKAIPLSEVEVGKNYAIVITTNSGLWRYTPGDTVKFTSTYPYKIKITGRTKHFINAFGEEVMIENTDKALASTCREFGVEVKEYTVAPVYFKGEEGKGGHEWLIEFETEPQDLELFANALDKNLQCINSDYEAKRYKGMALSRLLIRPMAKGTFHNWLRGKGKFGGQNKVPRLANHRKYLEEILESCA